MPHIEHPLVRRELSRETYAEYAIVKLAPQGFQTEGFTCLETHCKAGCSELWWVPDCATEYRNVKAALDCDDRSVIRCYHKPQKFGR